jgi:hypothetical protein
MSLEGTNGQVVEALADRLQLHVPEEIRRYKQWVVWRYEPAKDGKLGKIPYYASGGKRQGTQGSPADLEHLAEFSAALSRFRGGGFDGIGFAVLPNSPVKAIDLDHCVEHGKVIPEAAAIVTEADSYTEFSPSGGGIRILVYGSLPSCKAMNRYGPGRNLELFGVSGFVTITGNVLTDNVIRPMTPAFQAWVTEQAGEQKAQKPNGDHPPLLTIDENQRRDLRAALAYFDPDDYDLWMHFGMALKELGDVGRGIWLEWSQMSPRFDSRQAAQKWATLQPRDEKPIHYQSILYRARERGWVNPLEKRTDAPPPAAAKEPDTDLPIVFAETIDGSTIVMEQLVEDILTKGGLSVIYGESNSGKSFLACDMGCSIATGTPWLGRRTVAGAVLYVAGEGAESIKLRLLAWRQKHALAPKLAVIPVAVNLLKPNADARRVVAACRAVQAHYGVPVSMIIIDTLARAFAGGNENASEDMSAVIAHADMIRAETGAHVMFIHHSGKDAAKGSRGHSSLKAATDTEIEVTAEELTKLHTADIRKQRDLPTRGEKITAKFSVVKMDMHDQWGKPITTCVVDLTDEKPAPKAKKERGNELDQALCAKLRTAPNQTMMRRDLVKALEADGFNTSPIYRAFQRLAGKVITESAGRIHLHNIAAAQMAGASAKPWEAE